MIVNITEIADRARARWALIVFASGALVLALGPATAGAQEVTDSQYNSTLQLIQQGGPSGGNGPASPGDSSSGLPFTGLDVVAMFAVGAVLALAGYMLWRRSRSVPTEVGT